jgi:hypothetical protein
MGIESTLKRKLKDLQSTHVRPTNMPLFQAALKRCSLQH